MEQIKKLLSLNKSAYYITHLSIINCLLPKKMTPMEIEVMAAFMGLEGDIARYRFGLSAKKIVRSQLELSPAGLSNYITQLLRKEFLIRRGDVIEVLPILIPEPKEQIYLLKLENTDHA